MLGPHFKDKKEEQLNEGLRFLKVVKGCFSASDGFKDHGGLRGECFSQPWVHDAESHSNVPI